MKWSFQLVGIRQDNIQDKVTKLNSTTVLADKMISVPAYSSKELSWYPLCFHLRNLICNVLFKFFLTSYSCWAFASYFATHLYPRSSFYTVPDLTSIRAVITASCSVLYGRLAAALPTFSIWKRSMARFSYIILSMYVHGKASKFQNTDIVPILLKMHECQCK